MNDRIEKEGIIEQRKNFFEKIMSILDEAESKKKRDTTYGPFSFLEEKYYVRSAVVSSLGKISSIAGLKMFLALEVLEVHSKKNASKMSFKQLKELVEGMAEKKYSINYTHLDECWDIEKNREIICERLRSVYESGNVEESTKYLQNSKELFPYIFMDRLRGVVWTKLKNFFELCKQSVCSECSKKSEVYYQYIQAVALYEIFYLSLVQERAEKYVKEETDILNQILEQLHKIEELNKEIKDNKLSLEKVLEFQKTVQELNCKLDDEVMEKFNDNSYSLEIYQLLVMEFGISYYAMCSLLMVFEAIQVCDSDKQLSSQIEEKLKFVYGREIGVSVDVNNKRIKRYEEVNHRINKLLENQYMKYDIKGKQNYGEEDAIYTFMTELCKPTGMQNKEILRGLEMVLGYPLYCEKR